MVATSKIATVLLHIFMVWVFETEYPIVQPAGCYIPVENDEPPSGGCLLIDDYDRKQSMSI